MKLNFLLLIYIYVWLRILFNRFIVIINKIDYLIKVENINICIFGNLNIYFIKGGYLLVFVVVVIGFFL